MMVKSIVLIGVAVSTSPPPRLSTRTPSTAGAEFLGEGQHVLCRPSQAVECGDDESVPGDQCFEGSIEFRSRGTCTGDAVVDV